MPPRDPGSAPVPPEAKKNLTVKQQRDARRAEKVAVLKKQQAAEKRNRRLAIILGSVAAVAVVGLVVTVVVTAEPPVDPADISIEGLQTYDSLTANHVTEPVTYEQSPPVGGDHAAVWLNCGIYTEPVPEMNAVHDLEHGAVWVTYNPDEVTGADLETLQGSVPDTYITMSPWPDLQAPVVASAWGAQVELDGIDDPRLGQFIDKYWKSADAPEPGAFCVNGVDGEGKIA